MKNCKCDNFNDRFLGLRDFCVQQFPFIAEDFDALTTYELLEKVICYLKKIGKYTEEMGQKFKDLLDYVNGYFDNLDVESVINQIIQNMYDEGLITEAIDNILLQTDEKCRKLVYVNCYGAKGDGVTDDTGAIQNCINANPFATFIFYGKYRITKTINIKFGTRTLLLSEMMWDGASGGAMFKIDEDRDVEIKRGGGTTIIGGSIGSVNRDNPKLGIGIWNDQFATRLSNVRIRDYLFYGILNAHTVSNWKSEDNKTTGMQINNCLISNFPVQRGVAVAMVHTDNIMSNCELNGCETGIGYYGGNFFVSNTHITPTVTVNSQPTGNCVDVKPLSVHGVMNLSLSNMYFNGVPRSVINLSELEEGTNHAILINNCSLICGTPALLNETPIDIFMGGNQCAFNVDNLAIRCNPSQRVRLLNNSSGSPQNIQLKPPLIYNEGLNYAQDIFDVRNLAQENKTVTVCSNTEPIPANHKRRIGMVVTKSVTAPLSELNVFIVSSHYIKAMTSVQSEGGFYINRSFSSNNIELAIGKTLRNFTINNVEFTARDLFIINNTDSDYVSTIRVSSKFQYPFSEVYLYGVGSGLLTDSTIGTNINKFT